MWPWVIVASLPGKSWGSPKVGTTWTLRIDWELYLRASECPRVWGKYLIKSSNTWVEDMPVAFLPTRNRTSSQGRTEFKCKSVPHSHRHLCILTSFYQSVSPKGSVLPLLNSQRLCKNLLNRSYFTNVPDTLFKIFSSAREKNQQHKQEEEVKLSTDVNSSWDTSRIH